MSTEIARLTARWVCSHTACRSDEVFASGFLLAWGLVGVLAGLWLGPLAPLS